MTDSLTGSMNTVGVLSGELSFEEDWVVEKNSIQTVFGRVQCILMEEMAYSLKLQFPGHRLESSFLNVETIEVRWNDVLYFIP